MARTKTDEANLAAVIDVMEITGVLKGKTFSITGHLGRPREEIVAIIQRAGGAFEERPKNVWGRERFLITNKDWNANSTVQPKKSSKLIEAERNGWKILSENEFYTMLIDGDTAQKEKEAAQGHSGGAGVPGF